MSLLNKLERRFGGLAVPHVTVALIVGQLLTYLWIMSRMQEPQVMHTLLGRIEFIPDKVLEGEIWRLATFLILPPLSNPVCAFFFWYLFYLMGTALEGFWGVFRYNVYLLIAYVATVAAAFLVPEEAAYNGFLYTSVFLAFAFLNPDFEMYIFFLLPIRIKWLALITWIILFFTIVFGDWMARVLAIASVANFFLFFGKDIVEQVKTGRRRMARQAATFAAPRAPAYFHQCRTCGRTEKSDPTFEFRYCSKCAGNCCYCQEHLKTHDHVTEVPAQKEESCS